MFNIKFKLLVLTLFLVVSAKAQMVIGSGDTVDPSAVLELNVSGYPDGEKLGFLPPRLALKKNDDKTTIPNPAVGLLVYNLGTNPAFTYKGFVYWNGLEWKSFNSSPVVSPTIASLLCATTTLSPSTYTSGVPFDGILEVAYTGGNGGEYQDQVVGTYNGLTVKLLGDKLKIGPGKLLFSVSGTPTVTSPTQTSFSFTVLGKTCSATVGKGDAQIENIAFIGALSPTTNPVAGAEAVLKTPDGLFEVRFYIMNGYTLDLTNIQIRYVGPNATSTIMWQGGVFYAGGAFGVGGNTMTMTKNTWWGSNAGSNGSLANTAWGDPAVYYGAPEFRHYAWTSTEKGEKVVYMARFFMGAPSFYYASYATAKAVIMIEQISSK